MKKITKVYFNLRKTISINSFFNRLSRIPLLKRFINTNDYSYKRLKSFPNFIAIIFSIFRRFFIMTFWTLFLIAQNIRYVHQEVYLIVMLSVFIINAFMYDGMFSISAVSEYMVKFLKFRAKDVFFTVYLYNIFTKVVAALITAPIIYYFFFRNNVEAFVLLCLAYFIKLTSPFFIATLNIIRDRSKNKKIINASIIITNLGLCVLAWFFKKEVLIIYFIFNIFAFAFSTNFLKKFEKYNEIFRESIELRDHLDFALKDNTASINKADTDSKNRGIRYINSVFFKRHRKIYIRLIAVQSIAFFVVSIIYYFIFADVSKSTLGNATLLLNLFFLNTFRDLVETDILFDNCDQYLMRIKGFRIKKNIIELFKDRFRYLFKISTVISLGLSILYVFFYRRLESSPSIVDILMVGGTGFIYSTIVINSGIFKYSINPYPKKGLKMLFFDFIPFLPIVFLSNPYTIGVKTNFIIVLVLMVIYLLAGLILVNIRAPKNFRLKDSGK